MGSEFHFRRASVIAFVLLGVSLRAAWVVSSRIYDPVSSRVFLFVLIWLASWMGVVFALFAIEAGMDEFGDSNDETGGPLGALSIVAVVFMIVALCAWLVLKYLFEVAWYTDVRFCSVFAGFLLAYVVSAIVFIATSLHYER